MDQDRNNYERLDEVYANAGVEPDDLKLRIRLPMPEHPASTATQAILACSLVAVLLVALVHIYSFFFPGSWTSLVFAACLSVPIGLIALLVQATLKQACVAALAPFIAWTISLFVGFLTAYTLLLWLFAALVLAGVAVVATVVAHYYRCWLAPNSKRLPWYRHLPAWRSTLLGLSIFSLPLAICIRRAAVDCFLAVIASLLLFLAWQLVRNLLQKSTFSKARFTVPFEALRDYLNYAAELPETVQHAPGVLRFQAGTRLRRLVVIAVTFYACYLAVLPLTNYMPVFLPFVPNEAWVTAFGNVSKRHLVEKPTGAYVEIQYDGLFGEADFRGPVYEPPPTPAKPDPAELRGKGLDRRAIAELQEEYKQQLARHPETERAAREEWQARSDKWEHEQPRRFLSRVPLGWLLLVSSAWGAAPAHIALLCTFSVLGTILYPLVVLYAFLLGACQDAIKSMTPDERVISEDAPDHLRWQAYTKTLAQSPFQLERDALWFGTHSMLSHPVFLDRGILAEHGYIVGDSGSGKTALGVTSLVTQLIQRSEPLERNASTDAQNSPDEPPPRTPPDSHPVVIIDLKGDPALFHRTKKAAEDAGVAFKFFTNEVGKTSYAFNPFKQINTEFVSPNQVAETVLEALNLSHGEGYGRSYFSRVARRWLSNALRTWSDEKPLQSFDQIYELTQAEDAFESDKEQQDAFELIAVLESLASIPQLNVGRRDREFNASVYENAIEMDRVIDENQVVYFWLPAIVEVATVREIAKLAVYTLVQAARAYAGSKQIYLFIDEFQRIASTGFKIMLEQARSMRVGLILSNQSVADLQTPDVDLRSTVHTNTRCKITFSAQDIEQQNVMMISSGEAFTLQGYTGGSQPLEMLNPRFALQPRLLRNHIIEINDDPKRCVFHVARGLGLTQFTGYCIPVDTLYTCAKRDYDAAADEPWPPNTQATLLIQRRKPQPEDTQPQYQENVVSEEEILRPDMLPNAKKRMQLGQEVDQHEAVRGLLDRTAAIARHLSNPNVD